MRTGAPLFAATGIRAEDGIYDCRIQRLDVDRSGEADAVVRRITAAYTAVFEAAIRTAPEQYLWQHRRWKTAKPSATG
jgi:KDO2-lipid IV(A) lauroyltransferase